jgi:hypothetical protein
VANVQNISAGVLHQQAGDAEAMNLKTNIEGRQGKTARVKLNVKETSRS